MCICILFSFTRKVLKRFGIAFTKISKDIDYVLRREYISLVKRRLILINQNCKATTLIKLLYLVAINIIRYNSTSILDFNNV